MISSSTYFGSPSVPNRFPRGTLESSTLWHSTNNADSSSVCLPVHSDAIVVGSQRARDLTSLPPRHQLTTEELETGGDSGGGGSRSVQSGRPPSLRPPPSPNQPLQWQPGGGARTPVGRRRRAKARPRRPTADRRTRTDGRSLGVGLRIASATLCDIKICGLSGRFPTRCGKFNKERI